MQQKKKFRYIISILLLVVGIIGFIASTEAKQNYLIFEQSGVQSTHTIEIPVETEHTYTIVVTIDDKSAIPS